MSIWKLSEGEKLRLREAMIEFCLRCMEPGVNGVRGLTKEVTEGELAILPQVLEILLS